jgi:hypothetical protein
MRRHAIHQTPQRLTLFSSRSRTMRDATIHYGILEDGHRTSTSLGQSLQLNWRLPRIATKATQRLENLHNLIGGPKYMPQRPLSCLGFQEPKSNKLTYFHLPNLRGELKPMHQMQWQEHTKWSNPSLPNSTKETNAIEEEQGGIPQRTPRSRSNRFRSHRGDIDWWTCRSRSPLSFP